MRSLTSSGVSQETAVDSLDVRPAPAVGARRPGPVPPGRPAHPRHRPRRRRHAVVPVVGAVLVSMLLAVAVTGASVAVCAVVLRSLITADAKRR